jgi:hypothetical protein
MRWSKKTAIDVRAKQGRWERRITDRECTWRTARERGERRDVFQSAEAGASSRWPPQDFRLSIRHQKWSSPPLLLVPSLVLLLSPRDRREVRTVPNPSTIYLLGFEAGTGVAAEEGAGPAAPAAAGAAAEPAADEEAAADPPTLSSLGFCAPTAQNPKLLDSIQYRNPVFCGLLSAAPAPPHHQSSKRMRCGCVTSITLPSLT